MADKEEIKVNDRIFLLSADEAVKLPSEFLKSNNWWWLRTSGYDNELVAVVTEYGKVLRSAKLAYNTNGGVRPAIRFDRHEEILTLNRTNGGYYKYLGKKWIDITDYIGFPCLLKKKSFEAPSRFDATTNSYAISEIRKWLLDWYETMSIKRLLLKLHEKAESKPEMTPIPTRVEVWKYKVLGELWGNVEKEKQEATKEKCCSNCKLFLTERCQMTTRGLFGGDGYCYLFEQQSEGKKLP